jgi:hypothetical protein
MTVFGKFPEVEKVRKVLRESLEEFSINLPVVFHPFFFNLCSN